MIIPNRQISLLPSTVRDLFLQWTDFMYRRIRFNMPHSELHAAAHSERVLLYALLIGERTFADDGRALEILAHAAVFHDTCRLDEYLDTGHGTRAAAYYKSFCDTDTGIAYHPESACLMRYHDRDDNIGKAAIAKAFSDDAAGAVLLYEAFKDADALDRWRLGRYGLDIRFLRTDAARSLSDYAKSIVEETVPEALRRHIEEEMESLLKSEEK